MRCLRRIEGESRLDKISSAAFREKLQTKPVEQTIEEGLRWYGHVKHMQTQTQ